MPKSSTWRGLVYLNGDGVAKDYAAAFLWIRRAAEQGLPIASPT